MTQAFLHTHKPPILHRDLKSGNVLIIGEDFRFWNHPNCFSTEHENDGECWNIYVSPCNSFILSDAACSDRWMAPEVISEAGRYSIQADVYS